MKNTLKRINPKIILSYLALTLLVVLAVGPFLWLLSTALKSDGENLFQYPPQFIPEEPTSPILSIFSTKYRWRLIFLTALW
jgi:putative chitobiose transport system permease protein